MIRQVVNGKLSDQPETIYCVKDGKTVHGKVLYVVQNGRTQFLWQEKGTRENPYRIYTAADLALVRRHPDAYFLQMADIYDGPKGPLLSDVDFTGVYDGQGFKLCGGKNIGIITPLYIDMTANKTTRQKSAWFCNTNRGVITRVNFGYVQVIHSQNTGSMVAGLTFDNRGIIDQVKMYTNRTVAPNATYKKYNCARGVLASQNYGTIQHCHTTVESNYDKGGFLTGLAYHNYGTMDCCYVEFEGSLQNEGGVFADTLHQGSVASNCGYTLKNGGTGTILSYRYADAGDNAAKIINVGKNTYTDEPDFKTIIY